MAVSLAVLTQYTNVTDRWTDTTLRHRLGLRMHCAAKTNEPIWCQKTWCTGQGHETIIFWGQEVKSQATPGRRMIWRSLSTSLGRLACVVSVTITLANVDQFDNFFTVAFSIMNWRELPPHHKSVATYLAK